MRLQLPVLVAVVLGGVVGPFSSTALPQVAPARLTNNRHNNVVDVVKRASGAVVSIHSERNSRVMPTIGQVVTGTPPEKTNGMGTGIIIDPRGYIVTNQHVIEDVSTVRVRLHDGTAANARVLGLDKQVDLALLKIDVGRPLPVITLGTSSDLMTGEDVIAIGNAFGYHDSVSTGIISAFNRDVTLNEKMAYKSLIQTTAPINPGNSGGPLLNVNAEMIGVNVAIRAGANNIGFAIPVDTVMRTVAEMMSIRRRNGTWHGVIARDEVLVPRDDVTSQGGATTVLRRLTVDRVETGSPAAKAGLQRGDVITQVADIRVACGLELERALLDHQAGNRIAFQVHRGNRDERLDLVLQEDIVWRKLGLLLSPVPAELVSRSNQQLHGGLTVVEVRPDGVASRSGIQRGDILVGLHKWEMLTVENVAFVLTHNDLASFRPLEFFIVRTGQVHRGSILHVEN